jgi:hypothetical protein
LHRAEKIRKEANQTLFPLDTGERPYVCILCSDRFTRTDILKRHFEKCAIRRGNPTGASHLSPPQAYAKKSVQAQQKATLEHSPSIVETGSRPESMEFNSLVASNMPAAGNSVSAYAKPRPNDQLVLSWELNNPIPPQGGLAQKHPQMLAGWQTHVFHSKQPHYDYYQQTYNVTQWIEGNQRE